MHQHRLSQPGVVQPVRAARDVDRDRLRRWATGSGLLTFHVSLFLTASVVLFMYDLATSPADLWIDSVVWPWAMLLVIHGLTVVLLLLIDVLRGEDSSAAPTEVAYGPHHASTGPTSALPAAAGAAGFAGWPEAPPGEPVPSATDAAAAAAAPPVTTAGPATGQPWPAWEPATERADISGEAPDRAASERVSWEEAGIAAWLTRHSHDGDDAATSEAEATDPAAERGRADPDDARD